LKPLDRFQFEAAQDFETRLIREPADGRYIKEDHNVIFLGRSRTGKTHLPTGLDMAACGQGARTRFMTGCGIANELIKAWN